MFAITPVTTTPATLSVPPAAVAVTVSGSVSTRLTSAAVSAPLSNSSLHNDVPNPPATASETIAINSNSQTNETTGATVNNNGPSATFLAQLISQSANSQDEEDDQIALTTSSSHFSPAPTYNAFLGYSIVKYRPSDAGLTTSYTPSVASGDVAQGNAALSSPAIVTNNDYQAYTATQSRNQSNLSSSESPLVFAG